ncbi:flagellar hook-associated protein FlgK [Variovorax ginsengisoli]|nr:flagellar hook-associated protein FlgK [Variovorax ginsengisoli]
MFSTGLSGLNIARTALLVTSHNTANVNTEGYSRQTAIIKTSDALGTTSGFIGTGAQVTTVARSYDKFLTTQLSAAQSATEALSTYGSQISQVDTMLMDTNAGLPTLLQGFFTGVQAVANAPADTAARQQLISAASTLSNKFRSTDKYLSDLNEAINQQIDSSATQINGYAKQIATLNKQIGQLSAVAGGQPPNDLLDQRDQLVNSLSKLVNVKVLEQDNGQYNVFIGSGQSLVLGTHSSEVSSVNSAADPTRKAIALVDFAGKTNEVRDGVISGGSLGGLMSFREQTLTPAQNAIGRLAMTLSDTVNAQQKLGIDLSGALGKDLLTTATPGVFSNARNSGDLTLSASVSNVSALTTSDYSVAVGQKMVSGVPTLTYSVTRLSDQKAVGSFVGTDFPVTFDGVTVAQASGTAKPGDSFLVQPTRTGARDLDVLVNDPAKVAAAAAVATSNTPTNQGNGVIGAALVDAAYPGSPLTAPIKLTFDAASQSFTASPALPAFTVTPTDGSSASYAAGAAIPYTAGATISFGGVSIKPTGKPATGDTFTIASNAGAVTDGTNMLLLGKLQTTNTIGNGTSTFNTAYSQLVSEVGSRSLEVQIAETTQTSVKSQIQASQQSISGVNQDEETANLLMYQQMYQANAKVIQAASDMFNAILGIRT